MRQHTPGPWTFEADLTIRSRAFGTSDQMGDYKGVVIADLKPALGVCTDTAEGIESAKRARSHAWPETQANARLIQTAPELLKALKKEQEWREREQAGALDDEWDYETMVGQYRRAAIAAAEEGE
jgi:hypothetical protein